MCPAEAHAELLGHLPLFWGFPRNRLSGQRETRSKAEGCADSHGRRRQAPTEGTQARPAGPKSRCPAAPPPRRPVLACTAAASARPRGSLVFLSRVNDPASGYLPGSTGTDGAGQGAQAPPLACLRPPPPRAGVTEVARVRRAGPAPRVPTPTAPARRLGRGGAVPWPRGQVPCGRRLDAGTQKVSPRQQVPGNFLGLCAGREGRKGRRNGSGAGALSPRQIGTLPALLLLLFNVPGHPDLEAVGAVDDSVSTPHRPGCWDEGCSRCLRASQTGAPKLRRKQTPGLPKP